MKSRHLLILLWLLLTACQNKEGKYVCPPCDMDCDTLFFAKSGTCPNCKMELILKSELEFDENLVINAIDIQTGSGQFLIEGGFDTSKTILIHHHKPKKFTKDSNVLIVLPGAGRNGKEYRDAWKDISEKYDVLVLVPEYSEKHYPEFWSYNLAGMIYDVDVKNETFKINQNPEQWLFEDFDRLFGMVQSKLNLNSESYDMFGHSAGGQILHRLAIFKPDSKVDRILASNSGWYTLPILEHSFPYGLGNIQNPNTTLNFSGNLVVFLGANDNENETRGHLRRSPEVDIQGTHRLERGQYFYEESKKVSSELGIEFNWKLEIVPDIGHDYRAMSEKAGEYLYGSKTDK